MKSLLSPCSLALILLLYSDYLGAQTSSDFSSNADGWTAPEAESFSYNATGGNPTGHLSADPYSINLGATTIYGYFYFMAPGKFLGNRSAYYDGTLRFNVQQSSNTTAAVQHPEVVLRNGATALFYFPASPYQPSVPPSWSIFSIRVSAAGGFWKTANSPTGPAATAAQIRAVLTNLTSLEIRGLYRDGNTVVRLDNVTFMPPIVISTQPASTAVCQGTLATLAIAATGNANMSYQWQFETSPSVWTNLTNTGGYNGATTSSLTINTAGAFGAGRYRCRIAGTAVENVTSAIATVTVNALPDAPSTTGSESCNAASLTLTASGGIVEQYRWYLEESGGKPIDGETGDIYVTPELAVTTTYYVAVHNGVCESARTPVVATIAPPKCDNEAPVIEGTTLTTQIEGVVTVDLSQLITDTDDNIDFSTLTIVSPPSSGATAMIDNNFNLVINYAGIAFSGIENIALQVCDVFAACTQQTFSIEVVGEIVVYNAVSPNADDWNAIFLIEHIEKLQDTRKNRVTIFNRWGDVVWEGSDYNNTSTVFTGKSKNDQELPSGTYFYRIEFETGRKTQTGYLSLKR